MNRKKVLFMPTLAIAYFCISSYSSGPVGTNPTLNRTGAASSLNNCSGSGCHSSNSSNTIVNFTLFDTVGGTETAITSGKYIPNHSYKVLLRGNDKTGTKTDFGFQATVTDASSSLAGTIIPNMAYTALRTSTSIALIEHAAVLSGATASELDATFYWKAPAKGKGSITFYGILNAVNNNNSSSGDQPNNTSLSFSEDLTAGLNEVSSLQMPQLYPNPCTQVLQLGYTGSATFKYSIFDLSGHPILSGHDETSIDVAQLSPGIYFLNISNEAATQMQTFVKQ